MVEIKVCYLKRKKREKSSSWSLAIKLQVRVKIKFRRVPISKKFKAVMPVCSVLRVFR